MGFLLGGPYFHLKGRTGNNVGRVVKGRNVFSMRPTPSDKPRTAAQVDQQLRFGLMTNLLSKIKPAVSLGYRNEVGVQSPMNKAVSENMKYAITGVSPNFTADPLKLSFSMGGLSQPSDATISGIVGAELKFEWLNDYANDQCHPEDEVNLVVYNPVKAKFVFVKNAAMRSALTFTVQLPLIWDGDNVYAYLLMSEPKAIGTACSGTMYIGMTPVI